jgi:hypothetical protein
MLRAEEAAAIHAEITYNIAAYVNTTTSVPSNFSGSATAYFDSLSTKLSDTTALTSNLQAAATTNGATVLTTATVTGVSSTVTEIDSPPSGDDDDNKLSGGAIAGIVIGVIVGFALICLAVYFFFFRESVGYQSAGDSNFNARHHRNSKELPITL